jgi:hypothetical protein
MSVVLFLAVLTTVFLAIGFVPALLLRARVRRRKLVAYLHEAAVYVQGVENQLEDHLQWGLDGNKLRELRAPAPPAGRLSGPRIKAVAECVAEARELLCQFKLGGSVPGIGTALRCPNDWYDCLSDIKKRFAQCCLDVRGPCLWMFFRIRARDIESAIAPIRVPAAGSSTGVLHFS